jgi:signal transduction histidine kinase
MITTDFADLISTRMREENQNLAARWFERLVDLLPVDARKVFPSSTLLDHVPALILEIAASLRTGDAAISGNSVVLEKARELGALRHGQRASLHQVLREYQILGGVLLQFVIGEIAGATSLPAAGICVDVVARIHHAVDILEQTTVEAFVTLYTQTIAEQHERLEQFTRAATHEWRQPLGALQFGVGVLRQTPLNGQAERTVTLIERNVTRLIDLTRKLESVARIHGSTDTAVTQTVPLHTVAREAARQLREMAEVHEVDVRVNDGLPIATVDVGRIELALINLISNGIKYADRAKATRFVEVTGGTDADGSCRIEVRDNGIGIPRDAVGVIFRRFTRVHNGSPDAPKVDGVGLGLSIVDDCIRSIGGCIEVQSVEGEGTTFIIRLPVAPPPV